MRSLRLLPVLLGILLIVACVREPAEREIPADGSASAFVLNRMDFGITVYAISSAGRHRLGFVDAMRSGRFKVPGEMVAAGGRFQLLAEGRSGARGDAISEPFLLQPGSNLNWRLPANDVYVR